MSVAAFPFLWKERRLIMFQTSLLICALLPSALLLDDQQKNQKKDPPIRYEGVVSSVDKTNPNAVFVTIKVKEMMPTDKEDVVVPVDKNYQFKLEPKAKIFGLNGKPDKDGLKKLTQGTKVRVETKPNADKEAVEIRILASNG
jgi:hypothetical protein